MSTVKWISKSIFYRPSFYFDTEVLCRLFGWCLCPCLCSFGGLLNWSFETLFGKTDCTFCPVLFGFPFPLPNEMCLVLSVLFLESCLTGIMVITTDTMDLMENIVSWFSNGISYNKCSSVWIIQKRLIKSHCLNNWTFHWRTLKEGA